MKTKQEINNEITDRMVGKEVNGFRWFSHYKGVHDFTKRSEGSYSYAHIQCTEDQLTNGDIEFMTEHGWTLSKEKVKEAHRKYKEPTETVIEKYGDVEFKNGDVVEYTFYPSEDEEERCKGELKVMNGHLTIHAIPLYVLMKQNHTRNVRLIK